MCSIEEAELIIAKYRERNHIFSLDETWKIQKVIYLNDLDKKMLSNKL